MYTKTLKNMINILSLCIILSMFNTMSYAKDHLPNGFRDLKFGDQIPDQMLNDWEKICIQVSKDKSQKDKGKYCDGDIIKQ